MRVGDPVVYKESSLTSSTPKMKVAFVALLLLLISGAQAVSTSASNINITSQDTDLIQSNGQAQKLLGATSSSSSSSSQTILHHGKLYGSIEGTTRLNDKVDESINEHSRELYNTSRTAQGGRTGRAGGQRGSKGANGGANVNRRPRSRNSAPSLLSGPSFWTSTFILYVSLDLIILFPLHFV